MFNPYSRHLYVRVWLAVVAGVLFWYFGVFWRDPPPR